MQLISPRVREYAKLVLQRGFKAMWSTFGALVGAGLIGAAIWAFHAPKMQILGAAEALVLVLLAAGGYRVWNESLDPERQERDATLEATKRELAATTDARTAAQSHVDRQEAMLDVVANLRAAILAYPWWMEERLVDISTLHPGPYRLMAAQNWVTQIVNTTGIGPKRTQEVGRLLYGQPSDKAMFESVEALVNEWLLDPWSLVE